MDMNIRLNRSCNGVCSIEGGDFEAFSSFIILPPGESNKDVDR